METISIMFWKDTHALQRKKPTDFSEALTFPQATTVFDIWGFDVENMANILPAKYQHVSFVIVNILAC